MRISDWSSDVCSSDLGEREQPRVDRGFALVDVEPGPREPPVFERLDQRVLVDDLAARGVDKIGVAAQQREPPRIDQMLGLFGMRGADRDDVGDAQHVVEIGVRVEEHKYETQSRMLIPY